MYINDGALRYLQVDIPPGQALDAHPGNVSQPLTILNSPYPIILDDNLLPQSLQAIHDFCTVLFGLNDTAPSSFAWASCM